MFRVFLVIAWAVLLIVLLYLWADVREIAGIVKENKRELLRSNLSARASESFPNFQAEQEQQAAQDSGQGAPGGPWKETEGRNAERAKSQGVTLNPSEEQVLNEVLTEFLG